MHGDSLKRPMHRKDAKSDNETQSNTIQFRIDDVFFAQLSRIAERLHTSPGKLSRHWVAERLFKELSVESAEIANWIKDRVSRIGSLSNEVLEDGPVQVLHIVPLVSGFELNIEEAPNYWTSFPPLERLDSKFDSSINRTGFYLKKVFKDSKKISGSVQLFKEGQLESTRVLPSDGDIIFGDILEEDLVNAIWSYGNGLRQLGFSLPAQISVTFMQMKGYELHSENLRQHGLPIEEDKFSIGELVIHDWEQLGRKQYIAELIRPLLENLWHAAAIRRAPNYSKTGKWLL